MARRQKTTRRPLIELHLKVVTGAGACNPAERVARLHLVSGQEAKTGSGISELRPVGRRCLRVKSILPMRPHISLIAPHTPTSVEC